MENKPAVLIVDDDEGTCRTLNLLLQWKGYQPATAGTGEAALALAGERFFNVALVDIRLPDMTGTDLLAQLKKLHPDLEVLLITGYATLDSAMQAVAEGAYHYLTKPLNVDVLLAAIREALEKQRLTIKNRELLQEVQQELAERQRAEETLANERNLLRTLIDNLPDFIYVKDTASRFLVANTALARLMGAVTPDELLGKTDADFYPQELAAQFHADDQRIIRSGQPLINREEPLMDLATGKGGWLLTSKVPLRDGLGNVVGIVGIGHDITNRKRAEEALQFRMEQLATLGRASQVVTASLDLDQVLAEIVSLTGEVGASDYTSVVLVDEEGRMSQSSENMPGVPAIGYRIRDAGFTSWIVRSRQAAVVDEIGEGGVMSPDLGAGAPHTANPHIVEAGVKSFVGLPLVAKDRLRGVLYLHSLRPRAFQGQLPVLTTFANQAAIALENARLLNAVTTHREELQTLSTQLMNAQEEERKRISQELHDEIGQALTAMHINLTAVDQGLPAGYTPVVGERLEETMMLTDEVLGQVREMALNLRPSMLDDIGLPLTLRWHVNRYARRVGLEAQLEIVGLEERLAPEVETVLYRLVQEALNNIAKHAQASQVHIRLERKDSIVTALVEDDGRGFDMQKMASRKPSERGVGLLGMRERVASLGGSFRIHSSPGQGARLSAEIPLPHGEGS